MLHNPSNWHWVSVPCADWVKTYLSKELTGIQAEDSGNKAQVTGLKSMEGDVDVSQRKGKAITIYDIKLVLDWEGSSDKESDVRGTITIPEAMHDQDEYVFEIVVTDSNTSKQPLKDLVQKQIVPQIRTKLEGLTAALIKEFGPKIQHAPGSLPPTGYVTKNKVTSSTAAQATAKSSPSTTSSRKGPVVNTVPLKITKELRVTAEDLYKSFVEPDRLTLWTRSPPVWNGAEPNAKFVLFGGGVKGEFVSLKPHTQIVQRWRLEGQWPQDFYSTLTLDLDQDDANGVTNLVASFSGVPIGFEEETETRFNEYYIRSLVTTFGWATIL